MTGATRKRGRPRKPFFKNGEPANPVRPLSPLAQALAGNDEVLEAEVRRDYGVGPYVPLSMAWRLLVVGDEGGGLTRSDHELIASYRAARATQGETARQATAIRSAAARSRKDRVRGLCEDLITKVARGELTRNSAVELILRNWATRGDGGPPPSRRTMNNWLA